MKTSYILTCSLLLVAALFSFSPKQVFAQQEVTWDELADLSYVVNDDVWSIEFGERVKSLEGKSIRIFGFMMPLEGSLKQKHFILSMLPLDGCQFCAPGTETQFIEVKVDGEGISYTYNAIEIAGTFELIPDAPMGVYFLIKDAKEVK